MKLTNREREVVRELVKAAEADTPKPRNFIADALGISPNTVDLHLYRIRQKSGFNTTMKIVLVAIRQMAFSLLVCMCALAADSVRILDTANFIRFEWVGTNAQVSADRKTWEDYDSTVYSKPVMLVGSNCPSSYGFLRANNATNWVEVLTNQAQGMNVIGVSYLRAMNATNQPPLPP